MAFVELFGETLLTKDGLKSTEDVLSGKSAVGIYFSAHWCPPCRGFTPQLAGYYSDAFKGKGMEIVFASSDKDQSAFDEYYGEMPWVALPYDKRDVKDALNKKYKVSGIPAFVVLGPDGKTITTEGRKVVSSDPKGEKYPWIPPTPAEKAKIVLDTLGSDAIAKVGNKAIGLYFSAHWCPPCRGFTPQLAEHYKNGLKDKMEIFFVSSDRDQASFDEYFAEMPWQCLPYDRRDAKATLSDTFGVSGIPAFVVLNSDGTLITTEGRSKIGGDPKGENLPDGWLPQPFNDCNDDPSDLNSETCLVALGGDEIIAAAVKTVAEEYHAQAGKDIDAMPYRFFNGPNGNVVGQLRKLTGIEDGNALVLMDISDDGGFYVCKKDGTTPEAVREFLNDYKAKKLERQQLKKT
jgi:nucleoredoxin